MMQRNPWWVPLLWYGGATAVTAGAGYLGYRELQDYQQESDQQLQQQQQAAASAQQESEARTRQTLQKLNPFFIAGTITMTGLGTFIMLRGMRRERMERRYH